MHLTLRENNGNHLDAYFLFLTEAMKNHEGPIYHNFLAPIFHQIYFFND